MPLSRRKSQILFVFSIFFTVATALVIVLSTSKIRDHNALRRAFVRIERILSGDERDLILSEELVRAGSFARSATEWTALLRYAWGNGVDAETLYNLAASAVSRHERNVLFRHLLRYSAIQTDRLEEARALGNPNRDEGSDLSDDLTLLSYLDAPNELPTDELSGHGRMILSALDGEPAATLALNAYTGDPRLLENAALAGVVTGDTEILETVRRRYDPQAQSADSHPFALLVAAAWLGDDDWLFEIFQTLPGRVATDTPALLIQGDSLMRTAQWDRAEPLYREIIAVSPERSMIPYENIAAIRRVRGDHDEAATILRRAVARFSRAPRLQGKYVTALLTSGQEAEAIKYLEGISFTPDLYATGDVDAIHHLWLLSHAFRAPRNPQERFESDLWRYVNEHPDAAEVAAFLASYLRVRKDDAGLSVLAGRYRDQTVPWVDSIEAVRAADRGALSTGDERFTRLASISPFWEDLYNAGLFALRHYPENRIGTAIDELARRGSSLTGDDAARAYFVILRAETARIDERYDRALQLTQRAIDLSPDEESFRTYLALVADRR